RDLLRSRPRRRIRVSPQARGAALVEAPLHERTTPRLAHRRSLAPPRQGRERDGDAARRRDRPAARRGARASGGGERGVRGPAGAGGDRARPRVRLLPLAGAPRRDADCGAAGRLLRDTAGRGGRLPGRGIPPRELSPPDFPSLPEHVALPRAGGLPIHALADSSSDDRRQAVMACRFTPSLIPARTIGGLKGSGMGSVNEAVDLRREGDVALITIGNPPVNALRHAVRAGIVQALDDAKKDPAIRAIVL